jgi:ABC-type nitrate/sulfonate/bicarbonate transport system substrate-binding protein
MQIRRWRHVLGFLVVSLVMTACGGGGSETAAAPEPPDTETNESEAPEELKPVRALFATLFAVPSLGDTAEALGIWDEMGLDVELLEGQEGVESLESGDVDIAVSSPNRFIGGIVAGADIKLVGPTGLVWDQYIIVRKDLGIDSLEEFKGGRYGITRVGSASHFGSERLAQSLGWDEDDREAVILGDLAGVRAALETGQIDWFTWSAEGALAVEKEGSGVILGNVGDSIGPVPFNIIAVSGKAIKEKPASLRAFCEGYYEAQRTLKADPDLATKILIEDGGRDPDITPRVVEDGISYLADDDSIPEEGWDTMAEATNFTIDGVDDLTGDDVREMYIPCSSL